jgi:hypothetical protein
MTAAAHRRLDRKARLAVSAAVIVLLAVPVFALHGCVSTLTADRQIVASSDQDDRVMFVGGHTMLLEHGSTARKIADWLKLRTADTRAFEIGDQTFSPNSVELTPSGSSQITQFALIMKGHSALEAHILVTGNAAAAAHALEEMRATRLRSEIVAHGVQSWRISAGDVPESPIRSTEAQVPTHGTSRLVVLLSR